MPTSLKVRHVLAVTGIVGVLMAFQNCAQPPDASESSNSSFEDSLPVAYDVKLDTVAHMSCSEIKTDVMDRAYFSYRAGAYNSLTGGLSITPEFKNATRHYSNTSRANVIASSAKSGNTSLNLSIRMTGALQSAWVSEEFRVGEEQESFLGPLSAPEVAGPVAAMTPGLYMNYFPGAQNKRLLEASVRFHKFENVSRDTRNALDNRSAMLVAGLGDTADPMSTSLRGPNGVDDTTAFGSGFFLRFALPVGYAGGERRVLASNGGVEEIDLATGQTKSSNWDCNTSYQFMIVRPEDVAAGRVLCRAGVDRFNGTAQQAALNAIRRVMRVEDWYVDLDNRCVLPRSSPSGGDLCYGNLTGRTIQYGVATCLDNRNAGGTTLCPHFVSVCIRR